MSPTIEVDFNGLKQLGKEFLAALPTANEEEANAGFKCFALAYIGMVDPVETNVLQAEYLMKIISRKHTEHIILNTGVY